MGSGRIYCETTLNYAVGEAARPVTVAIMNAREASLSWELNGFESMQLPLPVDADWPAPEFRRQHGPEIAALARELSGCEHVLIYPPIVRSPDSATQVSDYAPIQLVHSDFTDDFRPMAESRTRPYGEYIRPLLAEVGLDQQDIAQARRVLMLQFWRNIGPAWPDYPLAFCDATTVDRSELMPFTVPEYGGAHLEFETFAVKPPASSAQHHWYTFPGLGRDEVVVFRTYDSACAEAGLPFWTPHSAFRDNNLPEPAPRRQSVEIRALCIAGP